MAMATSYDNYGLHQMLGFLGYLPLVYYRELPSYSFHRTESSPP